MQTNLSRRRLLTGLALLGTLPAAWPADSRAAREKRCRQIKARIARIESQLRRAHSARIGRRHRRRRRELELERYRRCR